MTALAMVTVNPEQVYALVVGIETYQLGADYDLDGPARDGLRFTDWLLSHGVLPENIRFFVSPLAQNADVELQVEERGIKPFPATRDAIDTYIRNELITETMGGEVFYVFWGGHGILTNIYSAARRLLFADTTGRNKLNLDIKSLVDALGTSAYGSGFDRQILLIDACANTYFQGLYDTAQGEAAGQRYSATGEQVQAEQFVLFAAKEYEVAKNGSGTGLFSEAVLSDLQGQALWPDMKALTERIQQIFEAEGIPEPGSVWIKTGSGECTIGQPSRQAVAKTLSNKGISKQERLKQEISLLEQKLRRCFERRLLTDDPDREVTLEKLEEKLEKDIACKKKLLKEQT